MEEAAVLLHTSSYSRSNFYASPKADKGLDGKEKWGLDCSISLQEVGGSDRTESPALLSPELACELLIYPPDLRV